MDAPEFDAFLYENTDAFRSEVDALAPPAEDLPEDAEAPDSNTPAREMQVTLSLFGSAVKTVSAPTHDGIGPFLTVALVLLLATGVLFLSLSFRIGRLVTAGVALAVASWPGLLLLKLFSSRLSGKEIPDASEATGRAMWMALRVFAQDLAAAFGHYYKDFSVTAFVLLAAAGIGYAVIRILGSRKASAVAEIDRHRVSPAA